MVFGGTERNGSVHSTWRGLRSRRRRRILRCGLRIRRGGRSPTSVAARISAISGRANSVAPDAARVLRSEVIALLTLVIPPRDLNLNLKGSICKTFTQWNLFRELCFYLFHSWKHVNRFLGLARSNWPAPAPDSDGKATTNKDTHGPGRPSLTGPSILDNS